MFKNLSSGSNNVSSTDFVFTESFNDPSTSFNNENSLSDVNSIVKVLKEKEKDLELAAKIGASLLEQNKELQERNEFLEESLNNSNDAVIQLKHQLKQKNSFFYNFADFVDNETEFYDDKAGTSSSSNQKHFQSRLKDLENENQFLKAEAYRLEELANNIEEREHQRVKEYLSQLERANLKIYRLQEQISDRNKECENQACEVEKLMREISYRKGHEKTLNEENDDLQCQLTAAVENHENLKTDIGKLQSHYLEVVNLLNETEEELKIYRQKMATLYRTSSVDSLYDSLASELEASDSGCYNTPIFSARSEPQQCSSDQEQQLISFQMERIRLQTDCSPILEQFSPHEEEEENFKQIDNQQCKFINQKQIKLSNNSFKERDKDFKLNANSEESYELLSKAFVNAVRDCVLQEEQHKPRDRSTASLAKNSVNNDNNKAEIFKRDNEIDDELNNLNESKISDKKFPFFSHLLDNYSDIDDDDFHDNTPIAERMSFSAISSQSFNTIIPSTKSVLSLNQEIKLQKSDQNSLKKQQSSTSSFNSILSDNNLNDCVNNDSEIYNINGKLCKNTSCSPINFDLSNSFLTTQNKNENNSPPILTAFNNFNELSKICKPTAVRNSIFPSFLSSISSSSFNLNPFNLLYSNKMNRSGGSNLKSDKFSSNFFLDYNQPKIGEPGRPGTCDLNQSIRRLNIMKKSSSSTVDSQNIKQYRVNKKNGLNRVELNYNAFRLRRGLLPSKFKFNDFAQTNNCIQNNLNVKDLSDSNLKHSTLKNKILAINNFQERNLLFKRSNTIEDISSVILGSPELVANKSIISRKILNVNHNTEPPKKLNTFDTLFGNQQNKILFDCLSKNLASVINPLSIKALTLFPFRHIYGISPFILTSNRLNQYENLVPNYLNKESNNLIEPITKNTKLKNVIGLNIVKQIMSDANKDFELKFDQHIVLQPGVAMKFVDIKR